MQTLLLCAIEIVSVQCSVHQSCKRCLTMFDYGESTTGLGEVSIMIIVYMSIPFCQEELKISSTFRRHNFKRLFKQVVFTLGQSSETIFINFSKSNIACMSDLYSECLVWDDLDLLCVLRSQVNYLLLTQRTSKL